MTTPSLNHAHGQYETVNHTTREPTQAEKNIARAWATRQASSARGEALEYERALALLVFANARPPRKGHPRDHAGLGLHCDVCQGRCTIDDIP